MAQAQAHRRLREVDLRRATSIFLLQAAERTLRWSPALGRYVDRTIANDADPVRARADLFALGVQLHHGIPIRGQQYASLAEALFRIVRGEDANQALGLAPPKGAPRLEERDFFVAAEYATHPYAFRRGRTKRARMDIARRFGLHERQVEKILRSLAPLIIDEHAVARARASIANDPVELLALLDARAQLERAYLARQ